jgi:predicted MFS family arabinose efflux permease
MSLKNRSAIAYLGIIMSFRMLGLFMILPVFSVHAATIPGATATRIGIALGIYGLTQALLQMPLGMLSDRIGRRPIIIAGLILFALGSVIAALSHSMTGIIIGRAVQGTGAIGSTTLAFVADLTRDENRSKAMALIGLSIGVSFSIAMILGPMINAWFGLSGIFWLTAGMALLGLCLLKKVPNPPQLTLHSTAEAAPNRFKAVFKNTQLLRLDLGIFCLHLVLTALFLVIPILLTHRLHFSQLQQTTTYLVVLICAFIAMIPFILYGEKKRHMKLIFITAIMALLATEALLYYSHSHFIVVSILLFTFFTAFTLLEASLPSLISKIAPIQYKGTAMGVYSTSQFFGIFVGGSLGGMILGHYGMDGIFLFCCTVTLVWLIAAVTMKHPPYLSTLIFEANNKGDEIKQTLSEIEGVSEVSYASEENIIYAKVDKKIISENELRKRIEEVTL